MVRMNERVGRNPNMELFLGKSDAAVMDDTLISVSLEPMRMVTKLNRKSLRAPEKSGHHNVP